MEKVRNRHEKNFFQRLDCVSNMAISVPQVGNQCAFDPIGEFSKMFLQWSETNFCSIFAYVN